MLRPLVLDARQERIAARAVRDRMLVCLVREDVFPRETVHRSASVRMKLLMGRGAVSFEPVRWIGFGRFGPIEHCAAHENGRASQAIERPTELLDWIAEALDPNIARGRIASLRGELESSVENLTLALVASDMHRKDLESSGIRDVRTWSAGFDREDDRRYALEGSVPHGHGIHPGTKARIGMSREESVRYAPELAPLRDSTQPEELRFVALSKRAAQTAGRDLHGCWESIWPGLCAEASRTLAARGHALSEYVLVPMHPWQHTHRLSSVRASLDGDDTLVDLDLRRAFRPQLSLRTVEPLTEHTPQYHVKLAIGVLTTSAERTISPMSIHNGPRIARAVCRLARDAGLPVRILDEVASAGLDPNVCREGRETARHLGVIVRENPTFGTPDKSSASGSRDWLAAALSSPSPFSERSLAVEWIRAQHGAPSVAEAAQRFFEAYCRVLIVPTAQLLARYGVALEAHGQNSLIDIDDDGLPSALTIRDLGGVRIHTPRLARAGLHLDFAAESATCTTDLHEIHAKFSHCVFQTHLADLIASIERDLPGALRAPWAFARSTLAHAVRTTKGAVDPEGDLRVLLGDTIDAKCLLRMRLAGEHSRYIYAPVDNPLAR